MEERHLYDQIYALVRQVPYGKVVTYGQIAEIVGGCSARMVGYAMSALKSNEVEGVPWQRVINAQGKVSPHGDGIGTSMQEELLRQEGIEFDGEGKLDFTRFGWLPRKAKK